MTKVFTTAQALEQAENALEATAVYVAAVREQVQSRVVIDGRAKSDLINQEQRAVHGYAWIDTTYEALKSVLDWAVNLRGQGNLKDVDVIALNIAFGEYLSQMIGGIPMGQNEFIRPSDLSLSAQAKTLAANEAVTHFIQNGNTAQTRQALATFIANGTGITEAFDDETLNAVRDQYRRFTEERIVPNAHEWHLANDLIPDGIVSEMAELGTFGVCIPEEFGGLGLGKLFMCIVTEELSRGWIGAGSLGTRSEIAGELILLGGTQEQKEQWLPKIASGETLPTAVFTEPDVGSDLGSLKTRATQSATGEWIISGAKTWITHAARSDLMTLLARSKTDEKGYAGLSMFLAPKPRGDEGLLGAEQGRGFKQLMKTFEGARIQTAARAVGVACRAMELAMEYAKSRKQFGKSIIEFPRVSDKIAMMAVDILLSRELTYFSAREKDKGRRCDIEAGMAKLFAARTAWANADAALQIHGGNGYALEYEISRILCDARILNIFEGAGEIQAQVVAKGKLVARN